MSSYPMRAPLHPVTILFLVFPMTSLPPDDVIVLCLDYDVIISDEVSL